MTVKKSVVKKKRGRQGEGGGRPRFKIDYEQAEKLAGIQCTQEEIAAYLGCSVDTLMRSKKFCGIYKEGMAKGRMSMRRKQWKALEDGNTTMLVWLGKQYLGQKDKHEHSGNKDAPIEVISSSVSSEEAAEMYMKMMKPISGL